MKRILSEYTSEKSVLMTARVCESDGSFFIEYTKNGDVFKTEAFPGKSLYYVESAAENWATGIKVLNG